MKLPKVVILYWTNTDMFYLTDTDDDTQLELNKRLYAICNTPGVISGTLATKEDIPDFAIDATPD